MRMTNKKFARADSFMKACEEHDVMPTKRQASKFRMGKGKLWKAMVNTAKQRAELRGVA